MTKWKFEPGLNHKGRKSDPQNFKRVPCEVKITRRFNEGYLEETLSPKMYLFHEQIEQWTLPHRKLSGPENVLCRFDTKPYVFTRERSDSIFGRV